MSDKQILLLSREDLKGLGVKVSNTTLLRWEQIGKFPRRLRLAGTTVCWDRTEILSWIEERRAEREHWHYADAR